MTCKEFQLRFGISTRTHIPTASNELTEHLRTCGDCRQFFEMQQAVGRQLRLVRDSVPPISTTLDTRVLASYRDFIAGRTTVIDSVSLRKQIVPLVLSWRGAGAAAVLAAAILTLTFRRDVSKITPPSPRESATTSQSPNSRITAAAIPERIKPQTRSVPHHHPRRKPSAVSVEAASGSLPAGFRSLMYCDQLSCAEAMEVIRVQLPTSIAGLIPGSSATGDAVFADVLVGPDGIARGIRIVE